MLCKKYIWKLSLPLSGRASRRVVPLQVSATLHSNLSLAIMQALDEQDEQGLSG